MIVTQSLLFNYICCKSESTAGGNKLREHETDTAIGYKSRGGDRSLTDPRVQEMPASFGSSGFFFFKETKVRSEKGVLMNVVIDLGIRRASLSLGYPAADAVDTLTCQSWRNKSHCVRHMEKAPLTDSFLPAL